MEVSGLESTLEKVCPRELKELLDKYSSIQSCVNQADRYYTTLRECEVQEKGLKNMIKDLENSHVTLTISVRAFQTSKQGIIALLQVPNCVNQVDRYYSTLKDCEVQKKGLRNTIRDL
jgi:hypothetical protein